MTNQFVKPVITEKSLRDETVYSHFCLFISALLLVMYIQHFVESHYGLTSFNGLVSQHGLAKISCLPHHLLIFPQSYLHPGLNDLNKVKLIALPFSRLEKKKKSLQVKLYRVYKMTG